MDNLFRIFRMLGDASDLYVKEIGVKAVFLSEKPLLVELQDLEWTWEEETSLTKLLDVFIGCDISPQQMTKYLANKLEDRLQKAHINPYTLSIRVAIANMLISSTLWYMLQLWTGDMKALAEFDRLVRDFICVRLTRV